MPQRKGEKQFVKNILISIIIPTYNIAPLIERCITSIINQTYINLEIIIVDDGSIDDTPKVLEKLAQIDARIKIIYKKNGGVTSARLLGVNAAKGEWIGFVDGDDFIEPQMFQTLLENAIKYKADISHCGYRRVYPDGREENYYGTGKIVLENNITGVKDLLEGKMIEPGLCNKLFHKKLFVRLKEEGLMDLSIKNNEDLLMNYYLFKQATKSVYEDICPYHYLLRVNSTSTSKINENKLKDPIKVLKIMLNDVENLELKSILANRLVYVMISNATLSLKGQPAFVEHVRNEMRHDLRKNLKKLLENNSISIKAKLMALWVSICPESYGIIHRFYLKITGLEQKYRVG